VLRASAVSPDRTPLFMKDSPSIQRSMLIRVNELELIAELTSTATAEALWNALPLQAQANRWGDELYFSVPFQVPLEADARAVVQAGEVAYWPDGPALCFFFGPTPVSRPGEIRAASAVNICGTIRGDITALSKAADGAMVSLTREET
jgi:uncharacterized protein